MPNYNRWKGCMKAVPFEEKRLKKWEPPYIIQPKYDGIRCRAVKLFTGNYVLLSSEENVIYSVPHINEALYKSGMTQEFDGELYCHGMSFEEITSITSRTVNLHKDYKKIQFHVFDIVNDDPQINRLILLNNLKLPFRNSLTVSPFWLTDSFEETFKVYQDLINQNYEGIIIRHKLAPYERKRSTCVMKFKPKKEDIYEIVGVEEEISINGNLKNSLGALVCKSNDGENNTFNIGTGFTEKERKNLWEIREILIGKYAKVQYQHITSKKNVPRFPVFVMIEGEKK